MWVGVVAQKLKKLPDRVAKPLVERRVLKAEEAKVLGIFPVTHYPQRDRSVERDLHERLRRAVSGSLRADERTAALVVLMDVCGLTKTVFEGPAVGDAKERAKACAAGEIWPRPARDLVVAAFKGLSEQLQQNRSGH